MMLEIKRLIEQQKRKRLIRRTHSRGEVELFPFNIDSLLLVNTPLSRIARAFFSYGRKIN